MKKRIKRKIGNRIMKNIMDGRPLSKFDKKYLYAMNKPIIEKLKLNVDQAFIKGEGKSEPVGLLSSQNSNSVETERVEVRADNQLVKAYKVAKHPDRVDVIPTFSITEKGPIRSYKPEEYECIKPKNVLPSQLESEQRTNKDFEDAYDSLKYATELMNKVPAVTRVEEPSKWQKVKSKLKGWFAK